MRRNLAVEFAVGEILLTPQVTDSLCWFLHRDEGFHIHLHVLIAYIEDAYSYAYSYASIGQRTTPDLDVAFLSGAVGLLAKEVLVDGIHFVVAEQPKHKVVHLGNVTTNKQIRGYKCPQRDMRVLLVGCQARLAQSIGILSQSITYLAYHQHIGVVPMADRGILGLAQLLVPLAVYVAFSVILCGGRMT